MLLSMHLTTHIGGRKKRIRRARGFRFQYWVWVWIRYQDPFTQQPEMSSLVGSGSGPRLTLSSGHSQPGRTRAHAPQAPQAGPHVGSRPTTLSPGPYVGSRPTLRIQAHNFESGPIRRIQAHTSDPGGIQPRSLPPALSGPRQWSARSVAAAAAARTARRWAGTCGRTSAPRHPPRPARTGK